MKSPRSLSLLLATALVAVALPAAAATYVIDEDDGAAFDGIIDGVPFGAPNDGTPDQAGQALAVAVKSGVTDLRTILEFPLASLAGITSADIVSATLTFNVDDVIGTFGPGFGFDGTAAHNLYAWAWAGNGTVDLSDFGNVAGPPSGAASPGADGSVTDASLAISGPLVLTINLTTALKARLDAASTHMGVTLATDDNNTATSLDNLGNSGAGPEGVNGSILPSLTVVVAESDPPAFSASQLGCQNEIAAQAQKLATTEHKLFLKCFRKLLKDVAAADDTSETAASCAELLGNSLASKLSQARAKSSAKIATKCDEVAAPSEINSPCSASALSFTAVAECVVEDVDTRVQQLLRSSYADICALITEVALDAAFPTLCLVP